MPAPSGSGTPALTGGPDREYRSGEIEPSQVIQPQGPDGDWEEKTVVDDSQLYNTKDGPNTLSIGATTSDDELTIDEPSKAVATGLGRTMGPGRPVPPAARPGAAPARPPITPTPVTQVPEAAQGKLVVIAGNDAGREYPLQGKPITVGRGIDNDVVLTDIAVSRKHMSIAFDGSRYQLSDKGSGNGTIINQRVETGTRALSHGDRIEIGNTVFRFEHPASEKESWAGSAQRPPAPPVPKLSGASPAPPPPSPSLPLPANPPQAASQDSSGLPLPPPQLGPPSTLTGSSPVGDLALERPQPESAPLPESPNPWSPPPAASPVVPPPMASVAPPVVAPAPAAAPLVAPAFPYGTPASFVPLVPRGPITGRKLLIGSAATLVALIGIAIAGMLIGGDESLAGQTMEPPLRVEEMLLPLLEPLLELGVDTGVDTGLGPAAEPGAAVPDAIPSSAEPASASAAEPEPAGTETP